MTARTYTSPLELKTEHYLSQAAVAGVTAAPDGVGRWHVHQPDSIAPIICPTRTIAARVAYALARTFHTTNIRH